MSYFKYNNKQCYYEECGNGMPLLFLHGNTASSNIFCEVTDPFTEDYKVVLIDFLGNGKSDRIQKFAVDLWFDEAMQVISFLDQVQYKKVNLIGSSGGALVAINVALERPDLVNKVIADSFEGEAPLEEFIQNVAEERKTSKQDKNAREFYYAMHGEDWESVVDNDTTTICEHSKSIGKFFHKPINNLQAEIFLTGSREDEIIKLIDPDYYLQTYSELINKMGKGEMHVFEKGGHPALLSNKDDFIKLAKAFLAR